MVQFRCLRLQLNRAPKFAGGSVEIPGKMECARQTAMSLGVARGQPHRLLRLPKGGGDISLSNQRAGEIHVGQGKIWIQFHLGLKLTHCRVDLSLREPDPSERAMSLEDLWCHVYNLLKLLPT